MTDFTRPAADIVRELVAKRNAEDADRRRLGIVRLNEMDLLQFIDLPEGYELVSVHANWETRSVNVMVRSKTLDPVVVGTAAPMIDGSWNREVYIEEYTGLDEDDQLVDVRKPWYRMAWSAASVSDVVAGPEQP